jgi:hypothetical protein
MLGLDAPNLTTINIQSDSHIIGFWHVDYSLMDLQKNAHPRTVESMIETVKLVAAQCKFIN